MGWEDGKTKTDKEEKGFKSESTLNRRIEE